MTKRTNNDLQNTTQNTEDLATRTTQKTGELRCLSCYSSYKPVISHECWKDREVEHIRDHLWQIRSKVTAAHDKNNKYLFSLWI
jgi:hypothetical protein